MSLATLTVDPGQVAHDLSECGYGLLADARGRAGSQGVGPRDGRPLLGGRRGAAAENYC